MGFKLSIRVVALVLPWLTVLLSLAPASANTLVVTNLNDSGAGSLRATINLAAAGDTVAFTPGLTGTILLSGGTLVLTRNIVIQGNPGIIVDGNDAVRVLTVNAGVQASLNHLTIQRGLSSDGGGILSSGVLTLNNCVIRNNHATNNGGGLYANGGSYALTNTLVSDNEAVGEGGGIEDLSTSASTITSSSITGNVGGTSGGGIRHVSGQTLTIDYSTISGNQIASTASTTGGGISSQNGTLNISHSTISANKAHFAGGIYTYYNSQPTVLNLTESVVAGNTAVSDGGGMFVFGSTVSSVNTTFANNIATVSSGGGIGIQSSGAGAATLTLVHATVAANRATTIGGGINLITGILKLQNSIVAGNIAPTNADLNGAIASLGYNLVQTRGTSTGYIAADLPNGSNPSLANLTFNGGPTNTMLPLAGSLAINAIPAGSCNGTNIDQRDYVRPGSGCDIGAVEVNGVPPPPPPAATLMLSRKTHGTAGVFELPLAP